MKLALGFAVKARGIQMKILDTNRQNIKYIPYFAQRCLLHELFLSFENVRKEVQDLIVSCWKQSKDKICLALYLEHVQANPEKIYEQFCT